MREYVYTLNDFADFISKGMNESAAILSDEKKSQEEKEAAQDRWDFLSTVKSAVVLFKMQENSREHCS